MHCLIFKANIPVLPLFRGELSDRNHKRIYGKLFCINYSKFLFKWIFYNFLGLCRPTNLNWNFETCSRIDCRYIPHVYFQIQVRSTIQIVLINIVTLKYILISQNSVWLFLHTCNTIAKAKSNLKCSCRSVDSNMSTIFEKNCELVIDE